MQDTTGDKISDNFNRNKLSFSIVILTYNRPGPLNNLLSHLAKLDKSVEVIVVDNNSDTPLENIEHIYPFVKLIKLEKNIGIAGRNIGIREASGSIIITLDDDIIGITNYEIDYLNKILIKGDIGAICFKVVDEYSNNIRDWCHHRKKEEYQNQTFITTEITEGAVAFRKEIVLKAGLYPEEFFISHEGPDLAFRIMNLGYKVIYDPNITVSHSRSSLGRPSWRRYYYDTRNLIWLVIRNYPFFPGLRRLSIGIIAIAIYALRDGFFYYWIKGFYDGIKGSPTAVKNRIILTDQARIWLNDIEKYRPGIFYMIRLRFFRKKIDL